MVAAVVVVQGDRFDAAGDVTVIVAMTEGVQRGNAEKREHMRKNAERDDLLVGSHTAHDSVPAHESRR
jgi:mRNA-degrading endonuclease toxin of MazEF toxin-antitoxin module